MTKEIVINLDEGIAIAQLGIRRAYVFMGFAANLATDSQQHPFHLPGQLHLRMIPETVSDETYRDYAEAFKQWTIANGFRELIETFELFLDNVYDVMMQIECWEIAQREGRCNGVQQSKKYGSFTWRGVTDKLTQLEQEFGMVTEFNEELDSIKRARNCITHRRGIVGIEDLKRDKTKAIIEEQLIIKWHVMEWYGYNQDGSEFVPMIDEWPVQFPKGSPIKVRFPARSKAIPVGHPVDFSPSELNEICFSFLLKTSQVNKAWQKAIQAIGIPLNIKEKSLEELLQPASIEVMSKESSGSPSENMKIIRIDF